MRMRTWAAILTAAVIPITLDTAAADATRLIMTSLSPAGSNNSKFFGEWASRINAASKGTLNVEVRDGLTLANFGNGYERTMDDVVQIGWIQHSFVRGKFPLTEVTTLPFISDDNAKCSVTLWRLYKSGLVDSEYQDVVPLWFGCLGQAGLHFAKPIASNDNLSGLKVRINGKVPSDIVSSLGGAPISLPGGEMYESLQRGTIDGVVTSWSAFVPYKLQEVTKYHIETALGSTPSMFFMSKKKFDSLPPAAQKALLDNGGEKQSMVGGAYFGEQGLLARTPAASSPDHKIVQLTEAQQKAWRTKMAGIADSWAKDLPNGAKVVEAFRSLYPK